MSALCHSRRSLGSFIFVKLAAVGNFEQIEGKIRSYKIYCKGGISGNIQLLDLPLVMLRPSRLSCIQRRAAQFVILGVQATESTDLEMLLARSAAGRDQQQARWRLQKSQGQRQRGTEV